MLATTLLLIAAQDADALIEKAQLMTTAEPKCARSSDPTDITICGRRQADRYRVPLIVQTGGGRRADNVPAARETLVHRNSRLEDMSAFLVETGMAGVSARTDFGGPEGGKTTVTGYRPLAK